MCGRITQNLKLESLVTKYGVRKDPELDLTPHYNGAPGQDFVAVRAVGKERVLKKLRWGDIPSWARNKPGAKRLINARSETVLEKPTFRSAFRQRRCIIPVNGWFEWRPENGQKQPYWIRPEDTEVFSLAGIWESGGTSPGSIGTFVIMTMAAEPEIADIHHRQPVILDEEAKEQWLTPGWGSDELIRIARKGYKGAYDRWCANGGAKLDHGSGGMVPSRRSKTLPECQPFPVMGRVGGFTPWSCIARCVWRAGTG